MAFIAFAIKDNVFNRADYPLHLMESNLASERVRAFTMSAFKNDEESTAENIELRELIKVYLWYKKNISFLILHF